jgi:hypothetical protein
MNNKKIFYILKPKSAFFLKFFSNLLSLESPNKEFSSETPKPLARAPFNELLFKHISE